MKKPLVYLACGPLHQSGVEILLQRLGLKVENFDKLSLLLSTARKRRPDMVLFELGKVRGDLGRIGADLFKGEAAVLVVLLGDEDNTPVPFPHVRFAPPLDPRALHRLLCERVANYSRLHLRIEMALPGLFVRGDSCQFCEVSNLSAGGAYIKTGVPIGNAGVEFRLLIPLLGMKRELELDSEVVFQVTPNEANNYQQGAGIRFCQPDAESIRQLEDFLRRTTDDDMAPAFFAGTGRADATFVTPMASERPLQSDEVH
ncbi:MAG: hypothetical protein A2091_10165 [Desulfuromonadales bacterium GWD2_61_12]|nr:MAG: hypothetical protein A2005_03630 [Desulfuromonadales bacterium GWC2_61_20]OGR34675.1 MAG: hypothetical protein A2091_10165 [Desulfuromonadales bacterium GWD2_61_12]HAD05025.1 hypothetical protein [Desulfuromonas sp.]HBT83030.1 hypothetical protein [Desulfuromonas sp.]